MHLYSEEMKFPQLLESLLADRAMQRKDFAAAAKVSRSFVTDTLKGRRRPPLEAIEDWADALNLKGQERRAFIESAYLDHAPEEVRKLVARLRSDLSSLITHMRAEGHKLPKGFSDV